MISDNPSPEIYLAILAQRDEPAKARMDALYFLAQAYQPEYFNLMLTLLSSTDEDPELRSAIALTFGKLGRYHPAEQNPFLLALLEVIGDRNTQVKNYAAQGLGLIGREEAIPKLVTLLDAEDNILFSTAADALGRIGEPAAPYLEELLKTGADDAQCVAAWKLGEIRYVGAINTLVEQVKTTKNPEVMALSVWALGEIGHHTPEVMAVLKSAKKHKDPEVYVRAKAALKKVVGQVN